MRSNLAIDRADVCILLIDAEEGVTEQDSKVLGEAHEAGKGIIIAVNKWDTMKNPNEEIKTSLKYINRRFTYPKSW